MGGTRPGLFGKDEASRVLRNRLSFAGEGLALGFAFDAGLAGVQGASYIGGAIAGPIINTAGKVATTADSATGNVVSSAYNKLFDTYPALVMKKYFTTRGLQGPKLSRALKTLNQVSKRRDKTFSINLSCILKVWKRLKMLCHLWGWACPQSVRVRASGGLLRRPHHS